MKTDDPEPTTTDAGIPVSSDEHSLTVGPDGPIVLHATADTPTRDPLERIVVGGLV